VDTTERGAKGWKEAPRQGDFTDNSIVKLVGRPNIMVVKGEHPQKWKKGGAHTRKSRDRKPD